MVISSSLDRISELTFLSTDELWLQPLCCLYWPFPTIAGKNAREKPGIGSYRYSKTCAGDLYIVWILCLSFVRLWLVTFLITSFSRSSFSLWIIWLVYCLSQSKCLSYRVWPQPVKVPSWATKMADNAAKCKLSNSLFYFVGKREQLICYGITISL